MTQFVVLIRQNVGKSLATVGTVSMSMSPLWKIARWVYWWGNDTVCRFRQDRMSVSPWPT